MKVFHKRLDLTEREFDCLKKCIDLEKLEEIEYSFKKHSASEKATQSRIKKVKEKIQNAINDLRIENKKITHC